MKLKTPARARNTSFNNIKRKYLRKIKRARKMYLKKSRPIIKTTG